MVTVCPSQFATRRTLFLVLVGCCLFFFSSRRRHTRFDCDWSSDVCSSDLGQRQRLSLAAALARPSRLLLLDEPEQSLDPGFRKELAGLLREYAGHGGTVVMATHDLDFAAAAGARLGLISEGRGVTPGTGS